MLFRRFFARNATTDTRRLIGSSIATLSRNHSCVAPTSGVRCLAVPSYASRASAVPFTRFYATATAKRPGRPRAAASKSKATTKAKPKAKATAKSKAKPKPKKKKPTKKAVAKPKKRATKKQPTVLEAKRAKVNELRKVALLQGPKLLPTSGYLIYNIEHTAKGANATSSASVNARAYRDLPASQKERYDNTALANRQRNEATKKTWVKQHTPLAIKVANNARRHLNRISREPLPSGATRALARATQLIKDERTVKRASTPFIAFTRERWASGDFKDIRPADAAKSLGGEWRALSAQEKKKYHDVYREDQIKYAEEYSRVYGEPSKPHNKSATA